MSYNLYIAHFTKQEDECRCIVNGVGALLLLKSLDMDIKVCERPCKLKLTYNDNVIEGLLHFEEEAKDVIPKLRVNIVKLNDCKVPLTTNQTSFRFAFNEEYVVDDQLILHMAVDLYNTEAYQSQRYSTKAPDVIVEKKRKYSALPELDDTETADFTIVAYEGSNVLRCFSVHRQVLCIHVAKLWEYETSESVIQLRDIPVDAVDAAIHYMYTLDASCIVVETAKHIYQLTNYLPLPCLMEICEDIIVKSLSKETLLDILIASYELSTSLKYKAIQFARENLSKEEGKMLVEKLRKEVGKEVLNDFRYLYIM